MQLRAATRGSALARWQTDHVAGLLAAAHPGIEIEPVVVQTEGDRRTDVAIGEIGGRGVFVKEVQAAVLDGRADIAVHSAKDLTSTATPGLVIAAIPERADVSDALVGVAWAELPIGGRVATGSVRRRVQIAHHRSDVRFVELRGNIETRLARADEPGIDAVVVASAALDRLGLTPTVVHRFSTDVMVPQVSQGALAVECRADDDETAELLGAIADSAATAAVTAERAFLATIGGGCDLPVGAHATVGADGVISIEAMLASLDGHVLLRERGQGSDPEAVGRTVAERLLHDSGGAALLAEVPR